MSDDGSLDRLRSRLYSRNATGLGARKRRNLREGTYEVQDNWEGEPPAPPRHRYSPLKIILGASVVFFIGALGIAGYYVYRGSNVVSGDNIGIEVQGPATIGGGETLTLQLAIVNRNTIPLVASDLVIEYPAGTRSSENLESDFPRQRETLGEIKPGEVLQRSVKAVLFGPEGEKKTVKISLEYRVPSSNAVYYKEQTYDLTLSSSALSLKVDSYKELTSGQDMEFTITVASNAAAPLENVLLEAQYPFGFQFKSATPGPMFSNTVWSIGDLAPEEKRVIKIRGTLTGENEEDRVFRFSTGLASEKDAHTLKAAFASAMNTVRIKKPFIGVDLALDGDHAPEHVITPGGRVRADITWSNNLTEQISDAEILVTLNGDILDETSVGASGGFYRSQDNTIVWSGETTPSLNLIPSGGSGTVSFSFAPLGLASGADLRNGTIGLQVSIKGKRLSEENVPEEVNSTISRTVKLSSNLALSSQTLYKDGPIPNHGPVPPKAEKETTYTILWTLSNSLNTLENVTMTATLPSYVHYTGVVNPSGEALTYNPVGGKLTWKAGTLEAKGNTPRIKQVAFQVSITPSISQVGSAAVLVNEQTVTGFDTFSKTNLTAVHSALKTTVSDAGSEQSGKVEP